METKTGKRLIVVGDRVLISPEENERTHAGLYLPDSARDEMAVRQGLVIETGPGAPIGTTMSEGEEWEERNRETQPHYLPMQARKDDTAIFFRRAAVEIKLEGQTYLIVPHGAILALLRDGKPVAPSTLPDDVG